MPVSTTPATVETPPPSSTPSSTARLTEERRALIAGHLDSCAGCFDAYEFHAELKHADLATLPV
ncbi:MAG: hypothetical protein R2710_24095 [Acidimicrobiales bacterium]